jgi:hypothetical protein
MHVLYRIIGMACGPRPSRQDVLDVARFLVQQLVLVAEQWLIN